MSWTFYQVEKRDGPLALCRTNSALRNTLPPAGRDPEDPQVIVARTAGGSTVLRVVDAENQAPIAALDIDLRENPADAPLPLGTTDLDGRMTIPPRSAGSGTVMVYVRHGPDTMAALPVLPGAGDEPDLVLRPNASRLDIQSRIIAVQEEIIDQVAMRKIYETRIKNAITKKKWREGEELLKGLKATKTAKDMTERLSEAEVYAKSIDPEMKSQRTKDAFATTAQIIEQFFNPDEFADILESFEDDIKAGLEDAGLAAADAAAEAAAGTTPAAEPPPAKPAPKAAPKK
jgi:hypothetical protein